MRKRLFVQKRMYNIRRSSRKAFFQVRRVLFILMSVGIDWREQRAVGGPIAALF